MTPEVKTRMAHVTMKVKLASLWNDEVDRANSPNNRNIAAVAVDGFGAVLTLLSVSIEQHVVQQQLRRHHGELLLHG